MSAPVPVPDVDPDASTYEWPSPVMVCFTRHADNIDGKPGEWTGWAPAFLAHDVHVEETNEPEPPPERLRKARWSQSAYRWLIPQNENPLPKGTRW
jgi:hypothetical protein